MLRALTAAGAVTGVEERLGGVASRAGWLRDTRLSPGSSRCVRECTRLLARHQSSAKWFETKKERVLGLCRWSLARSSPRDKLRLPPVALFLKLLCLFLLLAPRRSSAIPRHPQKYCHVRLVSDLFLGSTSRAMILSVLRARFVVRLHPTDGGAAARRAKVSSVTGPAGNVVGLKLSSSGPRNPSRPLLH